MSNRPKTHNNQKVKDFLTPYARAFEVCEDFPVIDDIFSGVLALKTEGDTATRSLSRQTLFQVLQQCPSITVESINEATLGVYAYRSLAGYAALARVASEAIHRFIDKLSPRPGELTYAESRTLTDAPYQGELLELGLV